MEKEIIAVAGLGYGDEGKGSIVDYLIRTKGAKVIVRYNGGAQAGHNVVLPDGRHHTFSQFGSGTFVSGVKTYLSRFMIVNPISMIKEGEHLKILGAKDVFERIVIDEKALITTPFQISANKIMQLSWNTYTSSCGMGVGQTIEDHLMYGDKVLFAGDLKSPIALKRKLSFLQEKNRDLARIIINDFKNSESVIQSAKRFDEWLKDKTAIDDLTKFYLRFAGLIKIVDSDYLKKLINENNVLIFEGAQGALLDKDFGFYPHITKTKTTFANADELIKEAGYDGKIIKLGVLRGYGTRHGKGPFLTEDGNLATRLNEPHNEENIWQGKFRVGWQDLLTLRYAIIINDGVDCLAITNIDQVARLPEIKICVSYEYRGKNLSILDEYFEWGKIGKDRAKIIALKKINEYGRSNLIRSGIIYQCKPLDFLKFSSCEKYLDFLQSKDGAGIPIKIISDGPTWKDKRLVRLTNKEVKNGNSRS